MKNFFKGFEKRSSESSFLGDFAGGVDPTGIYTFNSAKRNALAETKDSRHGAHRGVATLGGIIGGGAVVAPAISGLIDAGSSLATSGGGWRGRLAGAAKGFVKGFKQPFLDIRHGIGGGRNILRGNVEKATPSLKYFQESLGPAGSHLDPRMVRQMPPGAQKELGQRLYSEGGKGLSTLGLSGGIAGGSAFLQYGGGRDAGEELRASRMGRIKMNQMKRDAQKRGI